jgi:hypothetical protein
MTPEFRASQEYVLQYTMLEYDAKKEKAPFGERV